MLLDWKQESGERTLATYKQRYPDGDSLAPTLIGLDLDTYRIESLGLKREADQQNLDADIVAYLEQQDTAKKRDEVIAGLRESGTTAATTRFKAALIALTNAKRIHRRKEGNAYLYGRI